MGVPAAILLLLTAVSNRCRDKTTTLFAGWSFYQFGINCHIGFGLDYRYPSRISFANSVSVARNVTFSTELPSGFLKIHDNVWINNDSVIDFTGGIEIGENTTISENVYIQTHSHGITPRGEPAPIPLIIGKNVWIGAKCVILPTVKSIGDNSIIGAGSVLTKSVPVKTIVAGNPAKPIRMIDGNDDNTA